MTWVVGNDTRAGCNTAVWFLFRRVGDRTEYLLTAGGRLREWRTKAAAERAAKQLKGRAAK